MRRGEGVALAALVLVGLTLFACPLVLLLRMALLDQGGPGPAPLIEALRSNSVLRALLHSLDSSLSSAVLALVLGTAMALVVGLSDLRAKGPFVFFLLLPMMIPPHVTAIAWIQALGPSSPVLQWLHLAPPAGTGNPFHSRGGVIALLALQQAPLVFLVVLVALRTLPREMSEAARIAGARPWRLLRRVVLPLLAPALVAACVLAFVSALGNFGIPALLGIPARYITLPVLIWRRLAGFGPSVLGDVAVLAVILAVLAVVVLALQMALQRRMRSQLIGPPQPPLQIALGRFRPWVTAGLVIWVGVTVALPMTALVATALVPTYGVPLTLTTLTWDNFAEVLVRQQVTLRAFANSTLTAGAAALVLAGMAVVLSYFLTLRGRQLVRLMADSMATLGEITYAIPGLVISIAFILAFLRPLPVIHLSLYNTLAIIFLAYLCAFFSIALKPVAAACAQIDPGLDDAARVSGAGFGLRMCRVFGPLVAPAAASGAILVFLTAYNEVTVSSLLWSTGTETIGTSIFNYEDGGYTVLASAMASVTVLVTVVLMAVLDIAGRRLPPGVVPWRI